MFDSDSPYAVYRLFIFMFFFLWGLSKLMEGKNTKNYLSGFLLLMILSYGVFLVSCDWLYDTERPYRSMIGMHG